MAYYKEAIEKIEQEYNSNIKLSQKGKIVGTFVVGAVKEFCEQSDEFAQAVAQSARKIDECIEATVKCASSSISDADVAIKAAQFYFPTAKVTVTMKIDLGDGGMSGAEQDESGNLLEIDFEKLFS